MILSKGIRWLEDVSRAILLIVSEVTSPISTCRDTDVIFIVSQDSNISKINKDVSITIPISALVNYVNLIVIVLSG